MLSSSDELSRGEVITSMPMPEERGMAGGLLAVVVLLAAPLAYVRGSARSGSPLPSLTTLRKQWSLNALTRHAPLVFNQRRHRSANG